MRTFGPILLLVSACVGCNQSAVETSSQPKQAATADAVAQPAGTPLEAAPAPAASDAAQASSKAPQASTEPDGDKIDPATVAAAVKYVEDHQVPDLRTRKAGIDWPSFLGPHRDSKSPEQGILTDWSEDRLRVMWTCELGTSYGIGTTSLGRYFQFDRYGDQARLTCLNAETGEELWKFEYPTAYKDILDYNNGPRCSPIVDNDRVYIFGADGMLCCVKVTDGSLIWKVDTAAQYGVVQNFFGVGSTPVIEGNLLIVLVGGSPPNSPETYSGRVQGNGSGVVAFDKYTGEEKYRLSDELASYSCPVVATIGDDRWAFVFARGGLIGLDPATGKPRFHFPWRAVVLESVNASTPLVIGDRVFLSETYGPGSVMLKIAGDEPEVIWSDADKGRDKSMQCHWNTPIYLDGYLYGSSGRHAENAELRCVRAEDGQVMWTEPGLMRSTLLYVDGHLICLSEDGSLRLLRPTPDKYDMVTGTVLTDPKSGKPLLVPPAWAAPILSHGLLYVRGKTHLVCVELILDVELTPEKE